MCIRRDHTHSNGKSCYVTSGHLRLTKKGLYRIGEEEFAAAYSTYTGSWYAYDLETGNEIAQFQRDFYERCIAPFKVSDLVPDLNCLPQQRVAVA